METEREEVDYQRDLDARELLRHDINDYPVSHQSWDDYTGYERSDDYYEWEDYQKGSY